MTLPPNPDQPRDPENTADGTTPDGGAATDPAPEQPAAPRYAPPQAPQQPAPGAPQYGAPQQPAYGAPQQPAYGAPQQPGHSGPQPQYGAPQYAAPQQPAYGAPQYAAPGAAYGVPAPGEPFDGAASPDDLSRPLYGASFGQAVKRFFQNYAKFSGRASRSEFWWVALFFLLIELVPLILYIVGVVILAGSAASYSYNEYGEYVQNPIAPGATGLGLTILFLGLGLLILIGLATIVPNIAITWRRLHDANFAGPFYFLGFIPYAGAVILIIFTVLGSKPEGRRFDV
ncbi:DUF805 domain-containing protein [Leucobacter allii]|uniref:DUF805 domain-containing protein n=1 Tax=Leucobacter allii TaxID=2932247 RepID=A0ABY4FKK9_9MICO|nr:DUF805 domain-containing protein [Leucobacter allii]UOQ56471.1 DUF805 domain-containing protein [Leucobacter allii]